LGGQGTTTSHKEVSASPLLGAIVNWSATGGDALRMDLWLWQIEVDLM